MLKHFYFEALRRKFNHEELAAIERIEANPVLITCRAIFDNARLGEWEKLWQGSEIPHQESSWGWHWGWRH